eukprot:gene10210-2630_t
MLDFKTTLLENAKKRFQVYFEDEDLILATFLDYRFKSLLMFSEEERNKIIKKIKLKMKIAQNNEKIQQIKPIHQKGFYNSSLDASYETEFKVYYSMEIMNTSMNPLQFYQMNKNFPTLFALAEKQFCIPATSTTSERAFSTMGRIVTKIRCKMNPETAGNLLFLKENTNFW